ncbi:MAG: aminotransferase class V-fold PLP-dependent enzyme, partial [Fidelibacterota bacterium]
MTEESLDTIAVHTAADPDKNLGTLSTPVYQSAMFAFSDADQAAAISQGEQPGYSYGRKGNPTQTALETALRELEGGQAALATSSGMAAITATFISILKQGDHIIASQSLYAATNSLMEEIMAPLGIKVTYVDARNPDHYASVLSDRTKILFLESPANPILGLVDIEAAVQFGHDHDLVVVMDNTFATPYNQRPLELGVDLVIHSASKYLGGHGDLIAGGIVGDAELIHRIRWQTHHLLGGTIAPFTAWLVLRGIRTLALRMERHNANALAVAGYLEKHPKVDRVYYPG